MADAVRPRGAVEWPPDLVKTCEGWLRSTDAVATLLEAETINAPALQVSLAEQRRSTEAFEEQLAAFQRSLR